jgi:hypothetical protein
MERMPSAKPEKKLTNGEALDWCIERVRRQPELEKYLVVLEQGKKDLKAGRVPEWDFMMLLKQMKFMLDADEPEDDAMMIQLEKFIDDVRETRRNFLELKSKAMEDLPRNQDKYRPKDEPLPPFTGGVIEA